jgi:hypothetical protein
METNKVNAPSQPSSAPTPAPGSSARLIVLLSLLVLALGALGYDFLVAKPACEAADKKIEQFVEARNKMGVKDSSLVSTTDIQKELGMKPTTVKENDEIGYTVEYYCWWGKLWPLNMRRHFIAVVYIGNEPRRYSAHYREDPPEEAFPIVNVASTEPSEPLPTPEAMGSGKKATDAKSQTDSPEKSTESSAREESKPAADKSAEAKAPEAKPAETEPAKSPNKSEPEKKP